MRLDATDAAGRPDASLLAQVATPYPAGPAPSPDPGQDPGRARNLAFFDKMYGRCDRGGTAPDLVPVVWLPDAWGRPLRVSRINGADRQLAAVSAEIDAMPADVRRYAFPPAGTYVCRRVADTGLPSMHGWGVAIDLNVRTAAYWHWQRYWHGGEPALHPDLPPMPQAIVDSFERHGFIWGGKWFHYDTMHFEYRPELLTTPP